MGRPKEGARVRLWTTSERVSALDAYDILDTPPEEAFEDIVEIARALTGAPIALVTLLDAERQWFKAARGAGDLSETPLSTSFCRLAVDDGIDALVIPDTLADPRTRDMEAVTGPLHMRSYAGAVLRTPEGVAIGSVCVLDVEPRAFPGEAVASLRALARQVMALLELRRASAERSATVASLRDANLGRELAMQAARLGRWDHRPHENRRFFDARAREILGASEDESVLALVRRIDPRDSDRVREALAAVMRPERVGPYDVQFRIEPGERWVSCVGRTLFDDGVCTRFFGVIEDITERKRLEEQRAYLSDELNHRVKNILSLAQSVAESTLRTAPGLVEARETLAARLQALARAHDVLLQQRWRAAAVREVAVSTLSALGVDPARVEMDGADVRLASGPALQLALALHELATNAGKYGALSNDTGRVALRWSTARDGEGRTRLELGWAERGGPPVAPPRRRGFGSRVVGRATEAAFHGEVRIDYAPAGLRWTVRAPLEAVAAPEGD